MKTSQSKTEEFFQNMDKKIQNLFAELKSSDFSKKIELEKRLEELKRNKNSIENEFSTFTESNKDVFQDIAHSFEESIEDLRKAFKKNKQ